MDFQSIYANTSNLLYKWLGTSFQMQVGKLHILQELQEPILQSGKEMGCYFHAHCITYESTSNQRSCKNLRLVQQVLIF